MFERKTVAVEWDGTKGDLCCSNSSQEFLPAVSLYTHYTHIQFLGCHIGGRSNRASGKQQVSVIGKTDFTDSPPKSKYRLIKTIDSAVNTSYFFCCCCFRIQLHIIYCIIIFFIIRFKRGTLKTECTGCFWETRGGAFPF